MHSVSGCFAAGVLFSLELATVLNYASAQTTLATPTLTWVLVPTNGTNSAKFSPIATSPSLYVTPLNPSIATTGTLYIGPADPTVSFANCTIDKAATYTDPNATATANNTITIGNMCFCGTITVVGAPVTSFQYIGNVNCNNCCYAVATTTAAPGGSTKQTTGAPKSTGAGKSVPPLAVFLLFSTAVIKIVL